MTRILHAEDPKAEDYRDAHKEVAYIRRSLSELRHRLQMLYLQGINAGVLPSDSTVLAAAGALDCAIVNLYRLVEKGDHSLLAQADRLTELWSDVAVHPEMYAIEPGRSKR